MAAKQLSFGMEARQKILDGVTVLSKAVKATLGPRGRNVVLGKKWGSPTVTKDGVTVAKEIELEEPYENMGAQMVKEVASKTSDVAGDGTTTATVLAESIYRQGLRNVLVAIHSLLSTVRTSWDTSLELKAAGGGDEWWENHLRWAMGESRRAMRTAREAVDAHIRGDE